MSTQVKIRQKHLRRGDRRAMTLVEMLIAVLIIFTLMALLIGAVRLASRNVQDVTHQSAVRALAQGVSLFQQEFGFIPPLVLDNGEPQAFSGDPINNGRIRIAYISNAQHREFLQEVQGPLSAEPDRRFSIYSLPYYIVGALDADIDGVDGPGFRTPTREGQFEARGRRYEPFFAVGSGSTTLYAEDADAGRIELRDSNGNPIRYYRWEPDAEASANAPLRQRSAIPVMVWQWMAGDPWPRPSQAQDSPPPSVLNARFAIVGAGPSGIFGDEDLLFPIGDPRHITVDEMQTRLGLRFEPGASDRVYRIRAAAMSDNVVEVGR